MKKNESLVHRLTGKVAQSIVRREYAGWPPTSLWGAYQPQRPMKKEAQPELASRKENK